MSEPRSIRKMIEQRSTDAVLAAVVEELLQLRTEFEINQRILLDLATRGMSDIERRRYELLVDKQRLDLLQAFVREWKANLKTDEVI